MRNKIYKLMQQEHFYIPVYVCMFLSVMCSVLFVFAMVQRERDISTGFICMGVASLCGSIALVIMLIASMFNKEFPKVTKPSE